MDTSSLLIITKGHDSANNAVVVSIFHSLHITLTCFIVVQSFMKIPLTFFFNAYSGYDFHTKNTKGNNFANNIFKLYFLFCASHLMTVYICTKFHEMSLTVLKLNNRYDFHIKISKGNNSVKYLRWARVSIFYTSSDDDLYLYQVS